MFELRNHHLHGGFDVHIHIVDIAVYLVVEVYSGLDFAGEDFAYA